VVGLLLIVLVALIWVAASQLIEPWKALEGRDFDGDFNGELRSGWWFESSDL